MRGSRDGDTKGPCRSQDRLEMCCGTEAGAYLRLIDSCITQLEAQVPLGPVTRVIKKKKRQTGGRWRKHRERRGRGSERLRYRGTSLIRNTPPPGGHHRALGLVLL